MRALTEAGLTARVLMDYESRGRPPDVASECPEDLLARVNRIADANLCGRSEAVQRLLRVALATIGSMDGLA